MPQRRTSIKALRQNRRRLMHNLDLKTDLRKTVKKFLLSIRNKNLAEAQANLKIVFKKFDKATKRNILHKKTAGRRKSRYSRLVTTIGSKN